MDPQHDDEVFQKVGDWLRSYKVNEFFDKDGKLSDKIRNACPPIERQMSRNKHTLPKLEPLGTCIYLLVTHVTRTSIFRRV
jgi:phosphoketolase